MLVLYQSQSRLSQKVWASRSFCLSRTCAGAAPARASSAASAMRERMGGSEWCLAATRRGALVPASAPLRVAAKRMTSLLGREVCRLDALLVPAELERARLELADQAHVRLRRNLILQPGRPEAAVDDQAPRQVGGGPHRGAEGPAALALLDGVSPRPGDRHHRLVLLADERWVGRLHAGDD